MSIPKKVFVFLTIETHNPEAFELGEVRTHLTYTEEEAALIRNGIEAKHLHAEKTLALAGMKRLTKIIVSEVVEIPLHDVSEA